MPPLNVKVTEGGLVVSSVAKKERATGDFVACDEYPCAVLGKYVTLTRVAAYSCRWDDRWGVAMVTTSRWWWWGGVCVCLFSIISIVAALLFGSRNTPRPCFFFVCFIPIFFYTIFFYTPRVLRSCLGDGWYCCHCGGAAGALQVFLVRRIDGSPIELRRPDARQLSQPRSSQPPAPRYFPAAHQTPAAQLLTATSPRALNLFNSIICGPLRTAIWS